MSDAALRIPDEILAEQWFTFVHRLIEGMQHAYRVSQGEADLTQKQIAEKLGKKASFVSRCLSGQQNMTIRTIHDLARAMDCRLEVTFRPTRSLPRANNQAISRPASAWVDVGSRDPVATPARNITRVVEDAYA
jgi:DNA-binding phage protein